MVITRLTHRTTVIVRIGDILITTEDRITRGTEVTTGGTATRMGTPVIRVTRVIQGVIIPAGESVFVVSTLSSRTPSITIKFIEATLGIREWLYFGLYGDRYDELILLCLPDSHCR